MANYGSEAGLEAYAESVGMEVPAGSAIAALTRASLWIDGRYGRRFAGVRTGGYAQVLAWPRTGAVTVDGFAVPEGVTPDAIAYATYEAALRQLASPGSLSPDYLASEQVVREKVGPIEVQYADVSKAGASAYAPVFSTIDDLLYPYLVPILPYVLVV